jgi:hypothetical protein
MACCMSYIIIKELEPLAKNISCAEELYFDKKELVFIKKEQGFKKELNFNYPFLEYALSYVLNHAEKAQVGCYLQQVLVL